MRRFQSGSISPRGLNTQALAPEFGRNSPLDSHRIAASPWARALASWRPPPTPHHDELQFSISPSPARPSPSQFGTPGVSGGASPSLKVPQGSHQLGFGRKGGAEAAIHATRCGVLSPHSSSQHGFSQVGLQERIIFTAQGSSTQGCV